LHCSGVLEHREADSGTESGQNWDRSETEVGHLQGEAGGEKVGPAAPLSHYRGGLSDRVHLEGWGKIPKQAAGCKNRQNAIQAATS